MLLAHLPAGFLLTDSLLRAPGWRELAHRRWLLAAGLLASVIPDADILWALWIDQNRVYHHVYWAHWPVCWLGLTALAGCLATIGRLRWVAALSVLFGLNALLHVGLDAINRDVWWGMPFVKLPVKLFAVPLTHQTRILDYVYHWTFALEILLTAWALYRIGKRPLSFQIPDGEQ